MKQEYIISNDPTTSENFPDLVLTKKGELICVFMECRHHGCREKTRLNIIKSKDKGRTWGEKIPFTPLADYPNGVYDCARITRLPDDSLIIICNYEILKGDKVVSEIHAWYSYDDGETWTEPRVLPFRGVNPDKYRILSNGRHVVGLHRRDDPEMPKRWTQYMYYSDDEGKTWNEVTIADDKRYSLCEVCILEVKPGTLVAFMREDTLSGITCMKAFSYDYGTTWEGVYESNLGDAHRPLADFYEDGQIFCTYRFVQGGGRRYERDGLKWLNGPSQNLFGAFFDVETALEKDRRKNFSVIYPISYDRNRINADTGYSGWVRFDDGSFYVVNYLVDDNYCKGQIRGYSFDITDVFYDEPESK